MRLAVFDLDGTIVDSQHIIVAAVETVWREAGMTPPPAAAVRRVVGLSLVEAMARLLPAADAGAHAELAARYKAAFAAARAETGTAEPLFPGIADALAELEAAGFVLGIATGKGIAGLRAVLDHHGLAGCFVTLQTADHGPGKPHPAMLERAMAETGVDPEDTVMVGDTTYDIEMAVGAGAAALGVGWGYHPPHELSAAGARAVVDRAAALPAAVAGLWAGAPEGAAAR